MKVILTKTVDKVGGVGDTINVAAGFAKNYLLAKGFASLPGESQAKQAKQLKQEKRDIRQTTQKEVIIKESKREKRLKRQLEQKNKNKKNLTTS